MKPLGRKKGSTEAAIILRQDKVLRLLLQNRTQEEIRQELNISEDTVRRDIAAVREELKEKIDKANLRPIKESFAEKDLLVREAWDIYNRPPKKGVNRKGEGTEEDDSARKLYAIDRLIKLSAEKDRLAGLIQYMGGVQVGVHVAPARSATEIMAGFLNQMPSELRNANIAWLRQKYGVEGRSRPVPTA